MENIVVESPEHLDPVESAEWQAKRTSEEVVRACLEQRSLHLRDVPAIVQRELKSEAARRGLRMGQMFELAWLFFADHQQDFEAWRQETQMEPES